MSANKHNSPGNYKEVAIALLLIAFGAMAYARALIATADCISPERLRSKRKWRSGDAHQGNVFVDLEHGRFHVDIVGHK